VARIIRVSHSAIIAPVVQPNIIVAVDHDAAPVSVELLIVPHSPMPHQVVPGTNAHALAQLALEDCGSPRRLPIAQLVNATSGPAAITALASASPM
jgi:hypothetical protein